MISSPFMSDHPSPVMASSTYSRNSRNSLEAFPDFPSSPGINPSSASNHHAHLEVPSSQPQLPQRPTRPFRTPSQRLPQTALMPASRNASRNDLTSPTTDHSRDYEEPPQQQRLPRAKPAPSLSGPPIRAPTSTAPGLPGNSAGNIPRHQPNAEELKSESLWADMQRTLADVELSAMKSSHLFNAPHSQALERLRETQLALAQSWARSEADEVAGQDSEDEYLVSEPEEGMQAGRLAFRARSKESVQGKDSKGKGGEKKARQGSGNSHLKEDLEEETERDIKMARKRREANDHYFRQVNHGVLDVVSRLDEVAETMRAIEKESRAVWDEMGTGGSTTASGTDEEMDIEPDETARPPMLRQMTKGTTTTTGTGTWSGTEFSDSPISPRKAMQNRLKDETSKDASKSTKEKGS